MREYIEIVREIFTDSWYPLLVAITFGNALGSVAVIDNKKTSVVEFLTNELYGLLIVAGIILIIALIIKTIRYKRRNYESKI